MKYIFLVSGGRNGSLFFQSLLDGHPEILQFPGVFYLDEFLDKIRLISKSKVPAPEIAAKIFIDAYGEFFDTRLNVFHRMGSLGKDRNEYFEVSTKKFFEFYLRAAERENSDLISVVKNLHIAWHQAAGDDVAEKKVILIHIHHASRIKRVQRFIENINFRVVFMERDIVPSLASEYKGWENYVQIYFGKDLALETYSWSLNRKLLEPIRVAQIDSQAFSILLEELHGNSKLVLNKFCKALEIKFCNCMLTSTFCGKLWWGDQLGAMRNGFNPDFANKLENNVFFQWEVELIECFVVKRRQSSGYPILNVRCRSPLYFLLPGKLEIENFIRKLINVRSTNGLRALLRDMIFSYRIFMNKLEILLNYKKSKVILKPLVNFNEQNVWL